MRAAALTLAFTAAPLAAQEPCRLALQLGFDISASVDAAEYELQRAGIAAALLAPEIVAGFLHGPGPVALSIFEWSGRFQQQIVTDWVLVRNAADLAAMAEAVLAHPRSAQDGPTAIGYALGFAATRFDTAPDCLFQTVDISGDGANNDGFPPGAAFTHFDFDGVTVNGLAIGGAANDIARYFAEQLIRGPGAFTEYAASYADFAPALRRKLERELRVMILGGLALPTGQLPL
ncbi:MAG: DUF1194 domain-containing protein [Proteobacteria bacterium]|nr:DUF1194 domain-containing protein [Pseudomonadota bacterium]